MLVYVVVIAQAATAHDGFWPPAGVTIALFALALCTRFPVHWTGWVQLALLFAWAFTLGGDAVIGPLRYLMVFAAVCLGGAEFFALVRKGRSDTDGGDRTRSLPDSESRAVGTVD